MRKALILFSLLTAVAMPRAATSQDIAETAAAAGSFGRLVAAVEAAGLMEVLRGDGPFTVFAPSDEAFAKLPDNGVIHVIDTVLLPSGD
jgi:uncharacterized surface protein with fasciclin (FAS1) repeats